MTFSDYEKFFEEQSNRCNLTTWDELPDIEVYMDQVITLINRHIGGMTPDGDTLITSSMINNYVKNGILPCPVKKRYSRTHLSRLIIICILKPVLPITAIGTLIDSLLKTRTEEEVLNFFCEHYKETFCATAKNLSRYTQNTAKSENEVMEILSLAAMQSAAISGGSKFLAESALSEICKLTDTEDDTKSNNKKTAKKEPSEG